MVASVELIPSESKTTSTKPPPPIKPEDTNMLNEKREQVDILAQGLLKQNIDIFPPHEQLRSLKVLVTIPTDHIY